MRPERLALSLVLLVWSVANVSHGFMAPLAVRLRQPLRVEHLLPARHPEPPGGRLDTARPHEVPSRSPSRRCNAGDDSSHDYGTATLSEGGHPELIDTHRTQGNPVQLLRQGHIPPFTWTPPLFSPSNATAKKTQDDNSGKSFVDTAALERAIASPGLRSVPGMWTVLAEHCGAWNMLTDPSHPVPPPSLAASSFSTPLSLTFAQARDVIRLAAAGLHALNLRQGDHIAFFSENSARWLLAEQGASLNGCPTAVRGAYASVEELQYIYRTADCKAVVLQDLSLLRKLREAGGLSSKHGPPRLVIVLRPPEGMRERQGVGSGGGEGETEGGLGPLSVATLSEEPDCGPTVSLEELLALGARHLPHYLPPDLRPSDLHTLVFTSGTTGRPKGVMLSHANILHQVRHIDLGRNPVPGDVVLSLLPCWHIFERSSELFALARGASLVYSSVRAFKADLQRYRPHYLIVVPRLLENVHRSIKDKLSAGSPVRRRLVATLSLLSLLYTRALKQALGLVVRRPASHPPTGSRRHLFLASFVSTLRRLAYRPAAALATCFLLPGALLADLLVWKKVRQALGGRQKLVVSGGSALARYLEEFYDAAGISVVSGYGLTETSPVIAVRRAGRLRNLVDGGVVGFPPKEVELEIRELEDERKGAPEKEVGSAEGKVGLVFTRGPQVMQGYYKDPSSTRKAVGDDGWLNTGDLGYLNPGTGDLVLTGRAKDLIVLSNGENVEPQPIEDAVVERCATVEQCLVLGHDKRQLSALVVVSPQGLAARGLLPPAEAERLDTMVGPSAVLLGCQGDKTALDMEADRLNADESLVRAVQKEVAAALTQDPEEFRAWEQIKNVHLLLAPFNVQSGLLTQTLKVKRVTVQDYYKEAIDRLYAQ